MTHLLFAPEATRRLLTAACVLGWAVVCSDEPKDRPQQDTQEAAAAKFLQTVVDSIQVRLVDSKDAASLKLQHTPLMKYSDPARGYLGAGVWRLGDSGRPRGLVALEYRRHDTAGFVLGCEFVSFTPQKLELTCENDPLVLRTDGSCVPFATLSGAAAPASSDRQRLAQMRNIARRFSGTEHYKGESYVLRLVPQPIDRYQDAEAKILDGAAFILAYGTNPELVLLIECDQEQWRYAVMRLASAEVVVELDSREVARFPASKVSIVEGPYVTGGHVLKEP